MNRRAIKQLIYGGFFLAVIFLIGSGGYFLIGGFSKSCFDEKQNQNEEGIDCGGQCVSCGVKYPKELQVSWVKIFPIADNKSLAVASIDNPNLEVGSEFSYSIDIYSSGGGILKMTNNRSFIYSGQKKYLLEAVDLGANQTEKAELKFSNITWKTKDVFSKPDVEIRDFKTEISVANTTSAFNKFTRDLSVGITGNDVKELQRFLKEEGFFNADLTNRFGSLTQASLMAYQEENGISPANGRFGPKTRGYVNTQIDLLDTQNSSNSSLFPVSVTGVVVNNDIESVSKTVIVALLRDKYSLLIGISKTEIENLTPAQSRGFKILFSSLVDAKNINSSATEVYVYAQK